MLKEILYTYLGNNGSVTTPILIEGIPNIKQYRLAAEGDKLLTNDGVYFAKIVTIPASEIDLWKEVERGQN